MNNKELTILIPCLNEEKTLPICIQKSQEFIKKENINAEILIADNGSTDKSVEIAKKLGANVVEIKEKGYGNALRQGTLEAKGKYVIMADSDDSYNFLEIKPFLDELRKGYDLVIGNRFKGQMEKNAMPFTHKYIGTPILSFLIRRKYNIKIYDVNCGLRGYCNKKIIALNCTSTGMEYASEMIIKAKKANLKICEIPINFYRDGRERKPHLNAIKDGIRHLKVIFKKES